MKYIIKRAQQEELEIFKREMSEDPNLGYGHPSFPRKQVIVSLLDDQGNLCAYTMQRIDSNNCHIEHFKPQTACRKQDKDLVDNGGVPIHEDIEYNNLLACFPRPLKRGEHEPGYGAIQRKSFKLEVSPLDPLCEEQFRFSYDGSIQGVNEKAIDAIEKLNLKHDSLKEQREAKIKEIGLHPISVEPLSVEEAQQLINGGWKKRLPEGFMEFCAAFRDAAQEHITSIEKQFEKAAQNGE